VRRMNSIVLAALALIGGTFLAAAGADPRPEDRPAATPAPAAAAAPTTRPAAGMTLAAQQRLADRLNAIKGGSLQASLSHNRAEWESLSPDQRNRFRQEALAFLSESPDQQDRLMRQYQRLVSLSADRQENYRQIAKWLKVVVDSMSPEERKALLEMPPEQKAKALLARKAELTAQGKLPAEPAAATTTKTGE
jgi:hypothetical protein